MQLSSRSCGFLNPCSMASIHLQPFMGRLAAARIKRSNSCSFSVIIPPDTWFGICCDPLCIDNDVPSFPSFQASTINGLISRIYQGASERPMSRGEFSSARGVLSQARPHKMEQFQPDPPIRGGQPADDTTYPGHGRATRREI